MAAIADRGRLIAGVDQDTYLFGFRNPATGQVEGFDIDIAREIARASSATDRIQLRVLNADQRESALQSVSGRKSSDFLDLQPQSVAFSTVYFNASKDPHREGFGNRFFRQRCRANGCARCPGTTSLEAVQTQRPKVFSATTWTDCLLMLQQGQVEAISTDDVVLKGQHIGPNVEVVEKASPSSPRHRGQAGEHRPGSIRQRCPRADATTGWQGLREPAARLGPSGPRHRIRGLTMRC
jgi:polar amino acid transport system substrate-binding protein